MFCVRVSTRNECVQFSLIYLPQMVAISGIESLSKPYYKYVKSCTFHVNSLSCSQTRLFDEMFNVLKEGKGLVRKIISECCSAGYNNNNA